MSRVLFLSSSRKLSADLVEGAKPLSPHVLRLWPYRDVQFEDCDSNGLDDQQPKVKLFLADMDSTLIGQECIDELADYAGVKDKVAEVTERAMQGELDFEEALRARVALLQGLPESTLQACFDERIKINPGAAELLSALKANGVYTVLVSGGFTFFASKIAEKLGFHEYHANILAMKDGVLTGAVSGDIVGAGRKAEVLMSHVARLGISRDEVVAIGDGANDLPMIEAAGLGVAYHAKPKLRAAANIRLDHSDMDVLIAMLGLG